MDRLASLGHLSAPEWDRLQQLLDRFEKAWQQRLNPGATVDLKDYLPRPKDPLRPLALQEMIKTDLEFRWKRGQTVALEFYLGAFPELGTSQTLPAKLVYEEYRVRQNFGDKLPLSAYQRRFPDQFAEVQKYVDLPIGATRSLATPGQAMEPAAPPPPIVPMTFHEGLDVGNGYTLVKRIGDGGFGEVWQATSQGGIRVAVKIGFRTLDHEECQRELQALELIKQLQHPYLLPTHAFWTRHGRLHIAMALAEGNLRDRLKQCRQEGLAGIPAGELVCYFGQVAAALDYLHSRQVLHRDIKPDNILLQAGFAMVADFGLARQLSAQHSLSVSGSGTPAYMAPEMFGSKVNANTDQYCLAVTYAELRLDRRLFPGRDLMELMMQHVSTMPNLDGLGPAESAALLKALDKKPDERYPSCRTFIKAVEQALIAEGTPDVQPSFSQEMLLPAASRTLGTRTPSSGPQLRTPASRPGSWRPAASSRPGPSALDAAVTNNVTVRSDFEVDLKEGQDTPPQTLVNETAEQLLPVAPLTTSPMQGRMTQQASWKDPAPAPKVRKLRTGLIAAVGVTLALVMAGVAVWMAKSSLDAKVGPLVREQKFEEALDAVDEASFLALPFKAGWREKVLDNWHGQVETLVSDHPDKAEKLALRILKRFPDDEQALEVLDKVWGAQVKDLHGDGDFSLALERLAQAGMPAGMKEKWRQKIETRWLARAKGQLVKGQLPAALETARALLTHFKDNLEAVTVRHEALVGLLTPLLQQFQKKGQVREELEMIKRNAAELKDGGRSLRRKILDALLAEAHKQKAADNLAGSQKTCQLILLYFKDSRELTDNDRQVVTAILRDKLQERPEFKKLLTKADDEIKAGNFVGALKTLDEADLKAINPGEQERVRRRKTTARAKNIDELLKRTQSHYRAKEYLACEKMLHEARGLVDKLEGAEADEKAKVIETWQALIWAVKPVPEKWEQAVDQFKGLVQSPVPERLKELLEPLCKAFMPIAEDWEKHLALAANAQEALKLAMAQLEPGAFKTQLSRFLVAVAEKSDGQRFFVLLQQAETELRKGEKGDKKGFYNCETKLNEAAKLAGQDTAKKTQIGELKSLWYAADPKKGKLQAAKLLQEVLRKKGLSRQTRLCKAFAQLADKAFAQFPDPEPSKYLAWALESIGLVLVTAGQDQREILAVYRKLIEETVPKLTSPDDWGKLLPAFAKASPNGWALACKAECLLEQNYPIMEGQELQAALTALDDNGVLTTGAYGHYVRALVFLAAKNRRNQAPSELAQAFGANGKALVSPHRRNRIIDLVPELARQLRTGGTAEAPFKTPARAGLAYTLLIKARQFSKQEAKELPDEALIKLALAAWYQEPAAVDLAKELTASLQKRLGLVGLDKDAIPLLLGQARVLASSANDHDTALDSYEKILDLAFKALKKEKEEEPPLPAIKVYELIARPGLDLAKQMSGARIEARRARLYAQQGLLLRDFHKDFPKNLKPLDKALKAYDQAVAIDPRAEYYTNRASTRWEKVTFENKLTEEVLKLVKQDVDMALATAEKEKYPYAFSLHGFLLETEGRWKDDKRERIEYFKQAREAYRKAIQLFADREDQKEEEPVIRINRSQVAIDLVHLETDFDKKKKLLDGARDDAVRATEFTEHRYLDVFWGKLGNVYEDRASMLGEKGDYKEAINAFIHATKKRDLPHYQLDLGRCYFKRAKYGQGPPTDLDEAAKNLKLALGRKEAKIEEKAEAYYWLGCAFGMQPKNRPLADSQFANAYDLVKGQDVKALKPWAEPTLIAWTQFILDNAAALVSINPKNPQVPNLLKKAEDLANDLVSLNAPTAARFFGRIQELKGDPQEAYAIYNKALAKLPKDKQPIDLFLARLNLLINEKFQAKLSLLKADVNIIAQSDRAHEMAENRSYDTWERAEAFAAAALARLDAATGSDVSKEKTTQYHKDAKEWLQKAWELATRHPNVGKWRKAANGFH